MNPDKEFVIGVDVGTLSTRAGIFDLKGSMVGMDISWKIYGLG
jgi:ribulose kinase